MGFDIVLELPMELNSILRARLSIIRSMLSIYPANMLSNRAHVYRPLPMNCNVVTINHLTML
jgi:hypothetical protein